MSKIDDGGAAFPKSDCIEPDMEPIRYGDGMTLRDYFAAAALQGDIANSGSFPSHIAKEVLIAKAKTFYRLADAMLQARKEDA